MKMHWFINPEEGKLEVCVPRPKTLPDTTQNLNIDDTHCVEIVQKRFWAYSICACELYNSSVNESTVCKLFSATSAPYATIS